MDSFLTPYGLSNSGQEKFQFTPFWGGPKPGCSDGLRTGNIESHNFFVLGPILVKLHILTRLIESFPMVYELWRCIVDLSRSPCLRTVQRKSFERSNFLVLRPVLLKNAYFNSANRQLFIDVQPKKLRKNCRSL